MCVALRSSLPSLGALLVVLAVAIDPFSQAIIDYDNCQRPLDGLARVPRTNRYNETGLDHVNDAASWMTAAFWSGVFSPPANTSSILKVLCPTGNCTFPAGDGRAAFSSLAMTHWCDDISSRVQHRSGQYTLPPHPVELPGRNGTLRFYAPRVDIINFDSPVPPPFLFTFETLLLNYPRHAADGSTCSISEDNCRPTPFAFKCTITPCVKTYTAVVNFGRYNETETGCELLRPTSFDTGAPQLRYLPELSLATDQIVRNGSWVACKPTDYPTETNMTPISKVNNTMNFGRGAQNDTLYYPPACVWHVDNAAFMSMYYQLLLQMTDDQVLTRYLGSDDPHETEGQPWLARLYNSGNVTIDVSNSGLCSFLLSASPEGDFESHHP